MKQKFVQQQGLRQIQKLSPQQVLEVRLLELSTEELLQRIDNELLDNEALEKGADENEAESAAIDEEEKSDDYTISDDVLRDPEDDVDGPAGLSASDSLDVAGWQLRTESTFYENLLEQLHETNLTEEQTTLAEYLIGSLEEDGLLHKDLQKIQDELMVYHYITASLDELEECLQVIQQFEPAGVGGRGLQECLLLQVRRREKDELRPLMLQVLEQCFDDMCSNRWERIAQKLTLQAAQVEAVRKELSRLNPKPGGSMYADGLNAHTILPDFLLTVEDDDIQVQLNNGRVPTLHVSRSYHEVLAQAEKKGQPSKKAQEELQYIKEKIERAQSFISAIQQRHRMLITTMRTIVEMQRDYFLTGDESLLRPMVMKDVAAKVGVDISTISRVCNSKYVQTPYGLHTLKFYFVERFAPKNAEPTDAAVSTRLIRQYLQEMIEHEDKKNPLSDMELCRLMSQKGYTLARRTVAKYREQLGIATSRLRKIDS